MFFFSKRPCFSFYGLNYLLWFAVKLSFIAIYGHRLRYSCQKVVIMVLFFPRLHTRTGTYLVEGEAESSPRHFISDVVGWITRYCTNPVRQLFLYVSELIVAVNDEDIFVFWFWSKFSEIIHINWAKIYNLKSEYFIAVIWSASETTVEF